jgi:spore coat protein JC
MGGSLLMWCYEKRLMLPINIKNKNPKLAKMILTQFGGYAGELGAALRYLTMRYTMPTDEGKALLTDIGTEELAHIEMINTIVLQLTEGSTVEELQALGIESNYVEHGKNMFPVDANGVPFSTMLFAVTGDPIVDLAENLAAEEKARIVYERLMDLTDDPDVLAPLSFLREREVIHLQRFGELLNKYNAMRFEGLL